jgi:hypothetical protein
MWNWWTFVVLTIICTIAVMLASLANNNSNIERFRARADKGPRQVEATVLVVGSLAAGAIFAAVITVIVGFLFGN